AARVSGLSTLRLAPVYNFFPSGNSLLTEQLLPNRPISNNAIAMYSFGFNLGLCLVIGPE
ncbi:MAG: hypothetical protein KDF65_16780, partial [Anaerolineae bacterium]|nr:hypothetical protein [Anaerolineae bacterium]